MQTRLLRFMLLASIASVGISLGYLLVEVYNTRRLPAGESLKLLVLIFASTIFFRIAWRQEVETTGVRCRRCGSALYETTRSADRAMVITCFHCGFEAALPPEVGAGPPTPPAAPRLGA